MLLPQTFQRQAQYLRPVVRTDRRFYNRMQILLLKTAKNGRFLPHRTAE